MKKEDYMPPLMIASQCVFFETSVSDPDRDGDEDYHWSGHQWVPASTGLDKDNTRDNAGKQKGQGS